MQNTHKNFKQLAIIGSTASGKTALSIELAKKMNAYILSIDSLSIYKEINIVSAKPTLEEREGVEHFGLDYISPRDDFDVTVFIELYNKTYAKCLKENKNLIIVGGTSFYLKMLIEGVSQLPLLSSKTKEETKKLLFTLSSTHQMLYELDKESMSKIEPTDRYRMEKVLNIYLETGLMPTQYFKLHPPLPTIQAPLPIYQIVWERTLLRERIELRTQLMVEDGLIDEICILEKKYGRKPNAMKAIGIKETLAYLDGIYTKKEMIEKITINTSRLAKRQKTFNSSQFTDNIKGSITELREMLL